MSLSLLYVTCNSHEEAERIARTLLEERLIACANILGAGTSVYTWQSAFEKNIEIYMLLKTRQELVSEVQSRIVTLHSYESPCIIELSVSSVNEAYGKWIKDSTQVRGFNQENQP